jgi:DNA-directed RNA polymerase specialized sigma24 family protein
MRKAISTLIDKQQNAIIARHVNNLSFNEIGRRMGVTEKTVIAHFKVAEKKMKKYYGICAQNKHLYDRIS